MIAIAAAATATETAIAVIAIEIATFGVTAPATRAATAVRAVRILETIAMNPTRAGLKVRANRIAMPAANAASSRAKIKHHGKTRHLARNRHLARSSPPAKTRRHAQTRGLAQTRHLDPAMKPSARPTSGANAAGEVGADAAAADVTAGRTPAMARGRISLQAKVRRPTISRAPMSPGQETLRLRQRRPRLLTSVRWNVRHLNRLLGSSQP
jgi:hypothetical protein